MSSEGWKSYELGEVVKVKGGKRLPKGKSLQEMQNAHPYIRVSDMGNRIIDKSKLLYVPDKIFTSISRYIVNDGDIILSIVGTIGLISQVTAELNNASLTENCVKFTNLNGVLREYLYYFLISENCQNEIRSKTVGTTQPKLPLYNINSLQIKVPSLSTQRRIADILSALDDKIELNRQTNATLEAIAQAIFKEWFVDNEQVDSWDLTQFSNLIDINPYRPLRKDEIAQYLEMSNVPTAGHRANVWTSRSFGSGTKFINGDTLFAKITPCLENGKTAFVDFLENEQTGWGSTEFIVLRPKPPLPPEYGYFLARSEEVRNHAIQNMVGTSGRQRTPLSCFDYLFIRVLPIDLVTKFGEIARKIMARIKANSEEIKSLAQIRDSLLPKLMTGEITV